MPINQSIFYQTFYFDFYSIISSKQKQSKQRSVLDAPPPDCMFWPWLFLPRHFLLQGWLIDGGAAPINLHLGLPSLEAAIRFPSIIVTSIITEKLSDFPSLLTRLDSGQFFLYNLYINSFYTLVYSSSHQPKCSKKSASICSPSPLPLQASKKPKADSKST